MTLVSAGTGAGPRVLLTTRCRDDGLYDYFRENAPRGFERRFSMTRDLSFGLRFLRHNIPKLNILEYPTRAEYTEVLRLGWDVVGFSFYLEETNDILDMAEQARSSGVSQLWAGNYGALTPAIQTSFDRVIKGYAEHELAGLLDAHLDGVEHPPLFTEFVLPNGWPLPVGVLFSSRGCSFRCSFCQTTAFAPRPAQISLESIDRVLGLYAQHGVYLVLLLDENFGNLPAHSDRVIELLERHKLRWIVQARVDTFLRNFEKWQHAGMGGAMFGIESFHGDILASLHKREKPDAVFELVNRLHRAGLYAHGYYIIGMPSETPESVAADLETLAALELDVTQITIVTPHPETEMWRDFDSKYGIHEADWSKFDTKHLVWKHPNFAPGVLEVQLEEGFRRCYEGEWLQRVAKKFSLCCV